MFAGTIKENELNDLLKHYLHACQEQKQTFIPTKKLSILKSVLICITNAEIYSRLKILDDK